MIQLKGAAIAPALMGLALTALASTVVPASAQGAYYRPLTVGHRRVVAPQRYYIPPPAPYNPYAGPAVLITAPIGAASEAVALPFRILNAIFPARGNTPLTLIGGPIYAAGRLAQLPFRVAEAPFGGPNPFRY